MGLPLGKPSIRRPAETVALESSIGTFRAQGIPAMPAIARQNQGDMPWFAWVLPTEAGIDLAADVWHEILGLVYYFVRGWYR